MPKEPWTHLTFDFMTGLPKSSTYDAIFVVVDRLTKSVVLEPCTKKIDAKKTAELFMTRVFKRFGMPINIVSDRGPQFVARFLHNCLRPWEQSLAHLRPVIHRRTV